MTHPVVQIWERFETLIEGISYADDPRVDFAKAEGVEPLERYPWVSPEDAHRRYQLEVGGMSPKHPEFVGVVLQFERITVRVSYGMESSAAFDGLREIKLWAAVDYDLIVKALTYPAAPWGSSTPIRCVPQVVSRSSPIDQGNGIYIVEIAFEFQYASEEV